MYFDNSLQLPKSLQSLSKGKREISFSNSIIAKSNEMEGIFFKYLLKFSFISLTNIKLTKKPSEVMQKFPKINKIKETSLIEKIAKKSVIYNRR